VGVPPDGSVIVAGSLDGTHNILGNEGKLLAKTKTDILIQQRSVSESSDGKRIIVADQGALYGFDFFGSPGTGSKEKITSAAPSHTTISTPVPVKTAQQTVAFTKVTTLPEMTCTPKSEIPPFPAIIASAGLLFTIMRRKS
jgi:hypothetical protein